MNENSLTTGLRRAATSQRPFRADRNPPTAYRLMPRAFRISTFRRFDFSPFPPKNRRKIEAPQHVPGAGFASDSRGLVSPYVTFDYARLARGHGACLHPGPLCPFFPLCHLRFRTTCARETQLSPPSAPWPLSPSTPFFAYCHLPSAALRSVCTAPETAILPVLRKFDETCSPHRRSYGEV